MTRPRAPLRVSQCWPKAHRLRKRREYLSVQRQGRRFKTRDLVVVWKVGATPLTRVGITVSRKVAKQACLRNRVKRWIRESVRRLPLQNAAPSLDVAVIARPWAVRSTYQDIRQQLDRFWESVARSDG